MKKLLVSNNPIKYLLLLLLFWSSASVAADPSYDELQMKDYDEMLVPIKKMVKDAEKIATSDMAASKALLKDALRLIFSRPNTDNMVSQLVPSVRTRLRNVDAYEGTISAITAETISNLKNKKTSDKYSATGFIILENILSEIRPDIQNNPAMKKIAERIRDANIKMSDSTKQELKRHSMIGVADSPSELAKKILNLEKK